MRKFQVKEFNQKMKEVFGAGADGKLKLPDCDCDYCLGKIKSHFQL
jgi:hypothetical protein